MFKLSCELDQKIYSIRTEAPQDLSIPLKLDGSGPSHFGVNPLKANPLKLGGFTGDVSLGGSCNVDRIELITHCQGTHTETKAHIDRSLPNAYQIDIPFMLPATLLTIQPKKASASRETRHQTSTDDDLVITKKALQSYLESYPGSRALIIRTLPNSDKKLNATYETAENIAYFTPEAMTYIVSKGIEHLLVDMPSVDRIYDDGLLANHKIFWGIEDPAIRTPKIEGRDHATITEMIYAPEHIKDGRYGLQLSLLRWNTDAVPSKAVIYPLEEKSC